MAKCTGNIQNLSKDYKTGKPVATLEINEPAFIEELDKLKDREKLSIEIKPYREKRSLDSNAYYWCLIGKFAKSIHISNPEAHNMMLCRIGVPEIFDGKAVYITIPDTEDAEQKVKSAMDYHLRPTSQVRKGNDGIMYRTYMLLRGSSSFNTEEMSRLISELIVCCKESGISESEIATPDEKRILKERYGVDFG